MKILYVTTISSTVNAFLIPHIKMLINNGHQVDVAFNIEQEVKHEIYDMGCKVHQVPFQRSPLKKDNLLALKVLKNIIVSESYDLIHTHTPVASSIVRLACRRLCNIRVFYTAHGFHFYKGAPLKNWLTYYPIEKWLSKHTDCLITINEEDYHTAINKKFKADNIKLIHGVGIDLEAFHHQTTEEKRKLRNQYGYKKDDFILFYAAELNYNKHQDLLINAVSILSKKIPNIKLLLAGNGPLLNQYKRQASDLRLSSNICFLGYRNDIKDLLLISDIVVSASKREGLPVNIMEAMATGLPLVVTNVRGNRDLVKDGLNGFVVELDNLKEFTNAVEKIYEDTLLSKEFGKKSIEIIQKYSLVRVLEELEMIYNTPIRPIK